MKSRLAGLIGFSILYLLIAAESFGSGCGDQINGLLPASTALIDHLKSEVRLYQRENQIDEEKVFHFALNFKPISQKILDEAHELESKSQQSQGEPSEQPDSTSALPLIASPDEIAAVNDGMPKGDQWTEFMVGARRLISNLQHSRHYINSFKEWLVENGYSERVGVQDEFPRLGIFTNFKTLRELVSIPLWQHHILQIHWIRQMDDPGNQSSGSGSSTFPPNSPGSNDPKNGGNDNCPICAK